MKFVCYVVYDKVAKVFSNPALAVNTQDALRSYNNLISKVIDKENFQLCYLGVWDSYKGVMTSSNLNDYIKVSFDVTEASSLPIENMLYSDLEDKLNE